MENARLITETREALEQQTATAEVLQVINSSPGDLAPVFDAMLEKAMRLCDANFGTLLTYDGEQLHAAALHGVPEAFAEFLRQPIAIAESRVYANIVSGRDFVQVADLASSEAYRDGNPLRRATVDLGHARTGLAVPLRKDNTLLGVFATYRQEVRPFSEKQIALLQNFAAQAVIAMENARLLTETREALEQQTATAEVLQVINSSPGDLSPVFDAVLDKAMRLCGAAFGFMTVIDGERSRTVAARGVPAAYATFRERNPTPATAPISSRVRKGEPFIHTVDLKAERFYEEGDPQRRAIVDLGGARTLLAVPLMRDQAVLGAIQVYRTEVRQFTDKQVALLQNFAAQAVIAMENVRLITELRESLEYQTATSDVLRVVSRSTFDLDSVLQTVVTTTIRLCRADSATIYRNEGGEYRWAAGHMLVPEYEEIERNVIILPGTGTVVGRAALEGRSVQILDAWTDPLYEAKDDARVGGVHTVIGVPLLREGAPIGVIGLARRRVEAFSEREIQLVTTFADQAVIAIENARLITELRQRTHDLQELLEYQTASSDVLKVISRSGAELGPVLDTLVETAASICRANSGFIFRLDDGLCRMVASFGIPPEYRDFQARNPIVPSRGTLAGRTALERRAVHIEDAATDPEYTRGEAVKLGLQRTMLGVPLVREDALIGVITLARSHVEPFTEKQIGLVSTFADQAVIAIENARLFGELRTRTEELGSSVAELKMLSEVGQAVSSTLDLRAVLSTILNASLGVTWANAGAIFRYSRAERAFRLVEAVGWDEPLLRSVRDLRVAEAETAMGEAAAQRMPVQLAELAQRPSAPLRDASLAAGFHSALIVPLVGAERILGAIILMRQEAGEFPAETVRLMQTLASQSVLAIQNARLFREIADKSEQLALASQHKSQFLANMSHELRTPLNAILGYAELLVDGIYGVLPDRPRGVLDRIQNNGKHLLALINDVLDLAKIEAGQLTLTLEDYSVPEVVRSVVTATEPLATSKGLTFTAALQDDLPKAHGDARRVSQVLLNLVGNAIKFTDKGEVEIRAIVDKGQFVLTVRDTGPGIADADQERIFGEFQQIDNSNTRRKGGTGLGLAISKRMVEMQGGTISVDSVLGQGSTFRVVLPVHVDEMMEAA
jgi:GAF domain-containing protein